MPVHGSGKGRLGRQLSRRVVVPRQSLLPSVSHDWLIYDGVAPRGNTTNKILMPNGWIKSLLREGIFLP